MNEPLLDEYGTLDKEASTRIVKILHPAMQEFRRWFRELSPGEVFILSHCVNNQVAADLAAMRFQKWVEQHRKQEEN